MVVRSLVTVYLGVLKPSKGLETTRSRSIFFAPPTGWLQYRSLTETTTSNDITGIDRQADISHRQHVQKMAPIKNQRKFAAWFNANWSNGHF